MSLDGLLHAVDAVPAPIVVILVAFSPVGEVRASVPVAMLHYGMGWAEAFVWSILGNLLIAPAAWTFFPILEAAVRRWDRAAGRLDRIYARTRRDKGERAERLREAMVYGIIAIPVPFTGAWTGGLVAHVFGFSRRKVAPHFYAGVVTSTAIVTALVASGVNLFVPT